MFSPHNVSIHKVTPNTKPFPTKRFLHKMTPDRHKRLHWHNVFLSQNVSSSVTKTSPLLLQNFSSSVKKCLIFCNKISPLLVQNVSFCYKISPLLLKNVSSSVTKCLLFCYKMIMLQNIYFLKCFHKCVLLENKLY